jgi:uncharacterized protein YfaS (alpha-2-macroglobulin family)
VKDTYVLDGKEYDFTPLAAPNQPPHGQTNSDVAAGRQGIQVTDVTTAETPKGPVKTQTCGSGPSRVRRVGGRYVRRQSEYLVRSEAHLHQA